MAGELVPLVMVPRFTTYVGGAVFTTVALDVSAFGIVRLATWMGPLIGDTASGAALTSAHLQQSEDGDEWDMLLPMINGTDRHELIMAPLTKRFMRARVELAADTSDVVAVTCWSTGYLERRER
jgi:hypothetical protein